MHRSKFRYRGEFKICPCRKRFFINSFNGYTMMNSNFANRSIEILPEEGRLVRQAKSGDADAFAQLYDACVERVYRYVYFRMANDRIAEGVTFQVFFKAWEQLDRYQVFGSSFITWLYEIARNQVIAYYRTHKKNIVLDNSFSLTSEGRYVGEEVQDMFDLQAMRDSLQFLTEEEQQFLTLKFIVGLPTKNIARMMARSEDDVRALQIRALQTLARYLKEKELRMKDLQRILEECLTRLSNGTATVDECLARYPKHAEQLKPLLQTALLLDHARDVTPSPTFNAYTRSAVIQYVRSHPRQPRNVVPLFQRAALTFAMLVAALLVTGTVRAQSALPGDVYYGWKRTSELVWRALSL